MCPELNGSSSIVAIWKEVRVFTHSKTVVVPRGRGLPVWRKFLMNPLSLEEDKGKEVW